MITPQQAREWHLFKAQAGPTYAGSAGWKRFTDYVIGKIPEVGGVDFDSVDVTYDHYIVDDWPDRRAHIHNSGVAVEKLVTDGTPVPVVASYGMTSGSTPPEGLTAPMILRSRATSSCGGHRRQDSRVPDSAQPGPPYSNSFLDNYTLSDYEWRSPGKWAPLYTPPADQRHQLVLIPVGCGARSGGSLQSASRPAPQASSSCMTCHPGQRSG